VGGIRAEARLAEDEVDLGGGGNGLLRQGARLVGRSRDGPPLPWKEERAPGAPPRRRRYDYNIRSVWSMSRNRNQPLK